MRNVYPGPVYQKGVSKLALLMLALFIAAFFTVGLKVIPLYIDNSLLTGLAQELVRNGSANEMTQDEVRERFANSLRLNNVTGFDLSDIRVRRSGGGTSINITYERRIPLVANLELIAVFNSTAP